MTGQKASTSWGSQPTTGRFLIWLVIVAIFGIAILTALVDREPRSYTQDTVRTLQYNGALWGDAEVSGREATLRRLDVLPGNPPWPPYYNVADNETRLVIGDMWYGDCKGNNQISEIPATAVVCQLIG